MTPNLWWVYDNEQKSFSTLPTGPMLVPALLVAGLTALWGAWFDRRHTKESIAGNLVHTSYWQAQNKRYNELIHRLVETNNNLELEELYELNKIKTYINNPWCHK